ncbi:hypothetical protein CAPTEDRAFT_212049 [Capitella teleta]|uniref:Hemimethylated DNA-binding domain-containing protein n=1 Tax=Capitella teleta TaxID=283909 RepID=R7UGT7_CAPTE|nr:hypothetical protein CAPTEDRAFT_212049 [Capitella teleta]|eukprot:ELU05313.1 hypothetical protein CAPTEDRAFT_212049 [Capitella teleta]
MPLDGRAAFQLGVLLLALPLQLLISSYYNAGDETQRTFILNRLITKAAVIKEQLFTWDTWQNWCQDLYNKVKMLKSLNQESDAGTDDPALEESYKAHSREYFGASKEPRYPRPPHVKYRVGQVIKHKKWGYRGIIVGWDPYTKAPESWIKEMHPADKPHWRKKPSYSVLVDTRDRPEPQATYVAEENIEVVTNTKVIHPAIDDYFYKYDGAQYLPRPKYKSLYPQG